MYMYHPQILKVIELINQGVIGELVSMESNFGINILTKRNLFGFKKIKKLITSRKKVSTRLSYNTNSRNYKAVISLQKALLKAHSRS